MSDTLLQKVAAGETAAVAACVDAYGGLVWSLARRFLDHPSEAEDAVQEVFIEIWKNAARFDPTVASETTFVAMIARRRLIDRRRRDARRPVNESTPVDELSIPSPDTLDEIDIRDEAAHAASALGRLKPDQRRVLKLAVCQGWPHQLIADRLGMPLGTVKTHVRRGLIKLREELQADHHKPQLNESGKEAV
ncbi:MAG: sigma-70 family RNA polymerase sigma factor [Phycisphaerales bacterium]|nr:sigma-70 family RNA polymerase sigma factor [Phycisphaerales bacterium]